MTVLPSPFAWNSSLILIFSWWSCSLFTIKLKYSEENCHRLSTQHGPTCGHVHPHKVCSLQWTKMNSLCFRLQSISLLVHQILPCPSTYPVLMAGHHSSHHSSFHSYLIILSYVLDYSPWPKNIVSPILKHCKNPFLWSYLPLYVTPFLNHFVKMFFKIVVIICYYQFSLPILSSAYTKDFPLLSYKIYFINVTDGLFLT